MHATHNLQNFLIRENNVDRPYIHHDLAGGSPYDTMGSGRQMQHTFNGGTENNRGGWYRVNMPRDSQGCVMAPPMHYHTDSAHGNKSMGSLAVGQHSG